MGTQRLTEHSEDPTDSPASTGVVEYLNELHEAVGLECDGFSSSASAHREEQHPLAVAHRTWTGRSSDHQRVTLDRDLSRTIDVVRRWRRHAVLGAAIRTLYLLAGVGVCIASLPHRSEDWLIVVCGITAWATSHVMAAAAWEGRERALHGGQVEASSAAVLLLVVPAACVASAVAVLTHSTSVVSWTVWATMVATMGVLWAPTGRLKHWGVWVLLLGAGCWVSMAVTHWWITNVLSVLVIGTLGALVFGWLATSAHGQWKAGRAILGSPRYFRALIRVLAIVAAWVLVWLTLGRTGFVVVSWSTLCAGAAAEMALLWGIGLTAMRASRCTTPRPVQRRSYLTALFVLMMVAVAGAVPVWWWAVRWDVNWVDVAPITISAGAFMASICAGMLSGVDVRATQACVTMAAALALACATYEHTVVVWMVAALSAVGATAWVVAALARPQTWLIPLHSTDQLATLTWGLLGSRRVKKPEQQLG